ncbi:hypothetical protein ACFE04_000328 [Oxalis oulophora]
MTYFFILVIILFFLFIHGLCKSDIQIGHSVSVAIPVDYSPGFIGRAFLMESDQAKPNFRAALSVEAFPDRKFSCSLQVFLGDVKVWSSGHYSKFFTKGKCLLELDKDGDLLLKGRKGRVGWRTGTFAQGVQRLQILKTGNLVLVDSSNNIKWQSFNFPTDMMLWGQRLNVATRLTSFSINSSSFYTFEIQEEKIALYLNSGTLKYSYWEFKPSENRNISFIELGLKGLQLFNDDGKKIAQITTLGSQPPQFLALGNRTGNLGLYVYSLENENFEASYQVLNTVCDLPLACKPYGICTFSNTCSCIRLKLNNQQPTGSDCSKGISNKEFCGDDKFEMLELTGVSSVLRDASKKVNISKEACEKLCVDECKCVAALYSSAKSEQPGNLQECYLYELAVGIKQVEIGAGFTYMVKIPKGFHQNSNKSNVKKWVLILVGIIDGLIILMVAFAVAYYFVRKRRKSLIETDTNS